ncbi:NAD(P)-dependent oxidoreductase [Jiella endophytica]|uniref:NAD(P)-dependent oxidoreductase n=1 Tax=Jiella endophytica TaxID=2558362 RepID=A0A4Y8RCE2_9HYPH|nr:NAD(P)-dependent oxidoreductase [Jiella endophytica]TFF19136.1 NAD(P)-dependent oxidoreductase [Jiella endophytica]
MKTILVTGGAGWLGGAIVRKLVGRGDRVVAADLRFGPQAEALAAGNANLVNATLDLTDGEEARRVIGEYRPDTVIHCAAIVGVLQCADAPELSIRVNVGGMANLLEAMRQTGVRRMIHVSTEETYGDFERPVIDEDHPQRPKSIYGLTKLAAENLGRTFARNHEMECIHVRTCWVYGPDLPRPRMPKTYVDAALSGKAFRQASGGDFAVDQVHIDDTVDGIVLALDKADHRFDTYQIATGEAPTLGDVADIVNRAVRGASVTVEAGPYYLDDKILSVGKGALNIARAKAELGFKPRFPIERGIRLLIDEARNSAGRR